MCRQRTYNTGPGSSAVTCVCVFYMFKSDLTHARTRLIYSNPMALLLPRMPSSRRRWSRRGAELIDLLAETNDGWDGDEHPAVGPSRLP